MNDKEILEKTRMEYNIPSREWEHECFEGFYVPEICQFAMDKARLAGRDEFFSKCKGTKDLYDKGYSDAKIVSGFKHAEKNKYIEKLEKENTELSDELMAQRLLAKAWSEECARLREALERLIGCSCVVEYGWTGGSIAKKALGDKP
jgi:hypothetical protein